MQTGKLFFQLPQYVERMQQRRNCFYCYFLNTFKGIPGTKEFSQNISQTLLLDFVSVIPVVKSSGINCNFL